MQYELYLERLVHGDLGTSLFYGVPAGGSCVDRLPVTLWLIGLGALLLGGDRGAARDDRRREARPACRPRVRAVPLVGLGFPSFWLGIMLLLAFALNSGRLFPVGGYGEGPSGTSTRCSCRR